MENNNSKPANKKISRYKKNEERNEAAIDVESNYYVEIYGNYKLTKLKSTGRLVKTECI